MIVMITSKEFELRGFEFCFVGSVCCKHYLNACVLSPQSGR